MGAEAIHLQPFGLEGKWVERGKGKGEGGEEGEERRGRKEKKRGEEEEDREGEEERGGKERRGEEGRGEDGERRNLQVCLNPLLAKGQLRVTSTAGRRRMKAPFLH